MAAVGQGKVAAAGQATHAEPGDRAAIGIEDQAVVRTDGHGAIDRGIGIARRNRSHRDRRAAAITVAVGEGQNTGACLNQPAIAADGAAERRIVRAIKDERRVVGDVADEAARGAAIADFRVPPATAFRRYSSPIR